MHPFYSHASFFFLFFLISSFRFLFCLTCSAGYSLFSVCVCSKITVSGQDCSACKKKKRRERDHHKERKDRMRVRLKGGQGDIKTPRESKRVVERHQIQIQLQGTYKRSLWKRYEENVYENNRRVGYTSYTSKCI